MDQSGRDDLGVVLTRYPALARPCREPEFLGNAGGYSGVRLWRYEAGQGRLLARAWPADGPGRAALEQIHRWLDESAGLGFIPVPLRALDGRTVHEQGGRLWEIAPWLEGAAAAERPPAPARLRSGFAALAAFHQALRSDRTEAPSPGLRGRLGELDHLLAGGFDHVERALNRATDDRHATAARHWLALARGAAGPLATPLRRAVARDVPLQPCLRDARPEHILFVGDRVTGLVDFGAMGVDTVAADLSRLLGEWVGAERNARALALAAYAAIRPLEPIETALIDVFEDSSALLGAGHWIRWHFLEGRSFDDPGAVAAGIARGVNRLAARAIA
jgi:homoserine kinase type II